MTRYDVVVIGGGPAGAVAAAEVARAGFRTAVFEEHQTIGNPRHCTGKLSTAAFREFQIPSTVIVRAVNGAHFYAPDCSRFTVRKRGLEAYIMNRPMFDRCMIERAEGVGADLTMEARVLKVSTAGPTRTVTLRSRGEAKELSAKIVIDAEGSSRTIASALGCSFDPTHVRGIQCDVEGCAVDDEHTVEVYLSRQFAPGFFSWIVPLEPSRARVGLCLNPNMTQQTPRDHLNQFMKKHPVASRKLRNAKPSSVFGGIIPLHGPGDRTFGDGFMIVGDAAAQTKSTSGGGIYFGMKAGRIAGQVAVEALERNDASSKSLARFQRLCAESFGGELRFTSKIRRLLDRLGDNDLNTLLGILRSDDDVKSTIELHGDTSYQSKVWNPLLLKLAKSSFTRPRGLGVLAKTMVLGLLGLAR